MSQYPGFTSKILKQFVAENEKDPLVIRYEEEIQKLKNDIFKHGEIIYLNFQSELNQNMNQEMYMRIYRKIFATIEYEIYKKIRETSEA